MLSPELKNNKALNTLQRINFLLTSHLGYSSVCAYLHF